MNFYKRYPADYGRKTARLTLAQHGAYTLLLDEVYMSEAGLPFELDELYRICRAMNGDEQAAVRIVADRFFPVGADGLRHNSRATEELIEAAPAIEAARLNGKKGGRPRKETQEKPTGFSGDNPDETQEEPRTKPPQSSDISTSLRSVESRASRLPKPFELPAEWAEWAKGKRPELDPQHVAEKFADFWHGKPGKAGTKSDWLATWRNWVREERAPAARQPAASTGETSYQRSMRERVAEFAPSIARQAPNATNVIDMEIFDVPSIARN